MIEIAEKIADPEYVEMASGLIVPEWIAKAKRRPGGWRFRDGGGDGAGVEGAGRRVCCNAG